MSSWVLRAVASAVVSLLAAPAYAVPCNVAEDCEGGGFCVDGVCCESACTGLCEACSAAKKGGGQDGTCGQMPAGALCDPAHCDEGAFAFVDDSFCDAAGACIAPAGVDCLKNEPCKFDLCGGKGCEQVTMLDGTECGAGQVCSDGVCGRDMSSSSSAGGAGGAADGGATVGGAPVSSTSGAVGGASNPDLYPPKDEDEGGCGCRTVAGTSRSGAAIAVCALALVARRRRNQNRKRGGAAPQGS